MPGRNRREEAAAPNARTEVYEPKSERGSLLNPSVLLLAASVCLYVVFYGSIQTFLPTYLAQERGLTLSSAASLASVCCFMGIVSSLVTGIIGDKTGSRRFLGCFGLAAGAALILLLPVVPTTQYVVLVVFLGIFPPMLPVAAYAAVPEAAGGKNETGMALGVLSLGMNLGLVLGPVLFGFLVNRIGWTGAFYGMIPLAAFSAVFLGINRAVRW
jgi:sugar phosphate permease